MNIQNKKEIKDSKLVLFGSYPWTIDKKSILQEKVAEIFPQINWVYNKKGELLKQNFDASDAFVALLGCLNKRDTESLISKLKTLKKSRMKTEV